MCMSAGVCFSNLDHWMHSASISSGQRSWQIPSTLWNSCFSSVTRSCPTLCDPMDCSTPGLPVHHQLPKLTQLHVHQVGDAIQPFHPLSSLSPPSIFPSIRVFSSESVLRIRWPKYWSFSFSISPSNDIQDSFPLGLTGLISLQSKGLSRVFNT